MEYETLELEKFITNIQQKSYFLRQKYSDSIFNVLMQNNKFGMIDVLDILRYSYNNQISILISKISERYEKILQRETNYVSYYNEQLKVLDYYSNLITEKHSCYILNLINKDDIKQEDLNINIFFKEEDDINIIEDKYLFLDDQPVGEDDLLLCSEQQIIPLNPDLLEDIQIMDYKQIIDNIQIMDYNEILDNTEIIDCKEIVNNIQIMDCKEIVDNIQIMDYNEIIDCKEIVDNIQIMDCKEIVDNIQIMDCNEIVDNIQIMDYNEIVDNIQIMDYNEIVDNIQILDYKEILDDQVKHITDDNILIYKTIIVDQLPINNNQLDTNIKKEGEYYYLDPNMSTACLRQLDNLKREQAKDYTVPGNNDRYLKFLKNSIPYLEDKCIRNKYKTSQTPAKNRDLDTSTQPEGIIIKSPNFNKLDCKFIISNNKADYSPIKEKLGIIILHEHDNSRYSNYIVDRRSTMEKIYYDNNIMKCIRKVKNSEYAKCDHKKNNKHQYMRKSKKK